MSEKTYYNRKEMGLCTSCGLVPPRQGKLKCHECSEKKIKYPSEYHREKRAERLNRNPERQKRYEAKQFSKFYCTHKGRATHMLNNAHSRARKLGVNCTLTHEWIQQKLDVGVCEVTGIPFQFTINGGKGHKNNPFSPSLDRINQLGDYTQDNVRVTCWIYNRARGAFPDSAFDKMIEALIKK
jgi:hypothetical protein